MEDKKRAIKVSTLDELAEGFQGSRGITDKLTMKQMIAFAKEPVGGGENKLAQFVDGTLTDITAEDLDGATVIRHNAFYFSDITSIVIPDSVTVIGNYSLQNCLYLRDVTIGNSVTDIGASAFQSCSKLLSLTIPSSTTYIYYNALHIGSSTNKATITFLSTTPPTIQYNTIGNNVEKIIVPKGCGDVYKSATNFSAKADIIEEETK